MLVSMIIVLWNNSTQELSRKSMSKGKMRKRGKDRIHHKKWVEIGKCVGKIAYFGAFWANIMTWRHKDRSKDQTRLKISTKTGAKTGFTRKSQQRPV